MRWWRICRDDLNTSPGAMRRAIELVMKNLITKAWLSVAALAIVTALLLPLVAVIAGDALVAIGFYLIFLVYRENTFAAATIQVADNQQVISTGPYAIVRHPMYASASLYLSGTPLALDSWWGFVPIATMIPFLIWRLIDEERYLARHLGGYIAYQKRVRYRLIPFIW